MVLNYLFIHQWDPNVFLFKLVCKESSESETVTNTIRRFQSQEGEKRLSALLTGQVLSDLSGLTGQIPQLP